MAGFHLAAGPGRPPLYGPVDHHPAPARKAAVDSTLWVPVSLAEPSDRPSFLAGGENEKIVDGDWKDTWVPGCCQPREANATTEGSASEIRSPSHPSNNFRKSPPARRDGRCRISARSRGDPAGGFPCAS